MPQVRREQGRVWIGGVPPERPVESLWHFDGLPASLRAVLAFKGIEREYLEDTVLAAITGQPFRFWFSPMFEDCLAYTQEAPLGIVIAEGLGLSYHWRPGGETRPDLGDLMAGRANLQPSVADTAWEELKAEIDAGHPVILFGGDPDMDPKAGPVVVTGYDPGRGLVYFVPHVTWQPAPKWDDSDPQCANGIKAQAYRSRARPDETNWVGMQFAPVPLCAMGGATVSFFSFRERTHEPTEREVVLAVLRRAVRFGRGHSRDHHRRHIRPGLEALDLLIRCLEQEGHDLECDGRRRPWTSVGDWLWAMEGLVGPGFRRAAAAFVERCADGFGALPAAPRERLRVAARHYRDAGEDMGAFVGLFGSVGPTKEFPARLDTVRSALSSPAFRRKAAEVLRRVTGAEQQAVAEVETALGAA